MLMDAVVDYLPSPLDLPPMKGEDSDEQSVEVSPDDSAKVAGLAFKLINASPLAPRDLAVSSKCLSSP